jgi:uncharacterized membrane protein YeaQ/YmgE (transglycosylase-associated protein family)
MVSGFTFGRVYAGSAERNSFAYRVRKNFATGPMCGPFHAQYERAPGLITEGCRGSFFLSKIGSPEPAQQNRTASMWHILWIIIIGFIAGIIAKFIHPGSNEPQGFILTTILGIVGAFVATYLGQAIGWYKAGEGAGLIGAIIGAVILLVIWGFFFAPKKSV